MSTMRGAVVDTVSGVPTVRDVDIDGPALGEPGPPVHGQQSGTRRRRSRNGTAASGSTTPANSSHARRVEMSA
jgi:hypothetical protein